MVAAPRPSVPAGQNAEESFAASWAKQPRVDFGIAVAPAKVLIVKFVDWQCPSCKAAYHAYKPVLEKFEEIRARRRAGGLKDYPLSSKCNFTLSREMHQAACEEAAMVRMARDRGKEKEVIDWLFSVPESAGADCRGRARGGREPAGREGLRRRVRGEAAGDPA